MWDDSNFFTLTRQGPAREDCEETGPWIIQDDTTGRILYISEASCGRHAIEIMNSVLDAKVDENLVTVTAVTRQLVRDLEGLAYDSDEAIQLIDDFIYST